MSFDRILLIPAYIPPHKDHRPSLSFDVRSVVLKDWFGEIAGLEISDIEARRGGKSFTVDTIEALLHENPEDELYLLIGTDMFLSFETWHRYEDLLGQVVLVVGPRNPGEMEVLKRHRDHLNSHYECKGIILCDIEPIVCASSDLRAVGNGAGERALAHISKEMTVKRARHTMQVADYAKKLAPQFGVDAEKAYLAGLLHDCTKCYSTDWHIQYAEKNGIRLTEEDLKSPQILHQYTGAVFAKKELDVTDQEILSAIECHTTGKADMTPMELLLFFADSCEPSRTYSGVENIRCVGEHDLKNGVKMLLDSMVSALQKNNKYLHPRTLDAQDSLSKELE